MKKCLGFTLIFMLFTSPICSSNVSNSPAAQSNDSNNTLAIALGTVISTIIAVIVISVPLVVIKKKINKLKKVLNQEFGDYYDDLASTTQQKIDQLNKAREITDLFSTSIQNAQTPEEFIRNVFAEHKDSADAGLLLLNAVSESITNVLTNEYHIKTSREFIKSKPLRDADENIQFKNEFELTRKIILNFQNDPKFQKALQSLVNLSKVDMETFLSNSMSTFKDEVIKLFVEQKLVVLVKAEALKQGLNLNEGEIFDYLDSDEFVDSPIFKKGKNLSVLDRLYENMKALYTDQFTIPQNVERINTEVIDELKKGIDLTQIVKDVQDRVVRQRAAQEIRKSDQLSEISISPEELESLKQIKELSIKSGEVEYQLKFAGKTADGENVYSGPEDKNYIVENDKLVETDKEPLEEHAPETPRTDVTRVDMVRPGFLGA